MGLSLQEGELTALCSDLKSKTTKHFQDLKITKTMSQTLFI